MKARRVQLLTSRPTIDTLGLQHITDILLDDRCIACLFLDKHGNLVVRREGSFEFEPDTTHVGFNSPTQEIIIAPRRPR